jgi:threonine/homoserine efflux transporter RhtA
MLGLWWLVTAQQKALPAAAWGVALSSRANFFFLIPVAFGWLAQRYGSRTSIRLLALTGIVCAILTLPFYLYDPQAFAPLEAVNRLTRFKYCRMRRHSSALEWHC